MRQVFRTTLRLDLDKPASAQAASLLHQLHTERGLSYSADRSGGQCLLWQANRG